MQVGGKHYKKLPIEPWDYIAANGLGFFEGSIVKYITRAAKTTNRDDLLKAQHYLAKLLEITPVPDDDHNSSRSPQRDELPEDVVLPREMNETIVRSSPDVGPISDAVKAMGEDRAFGPRGFV